MSFTEVKIATGPSTSLVSLPHPQYSVMFPDTLVNIICPLCWERSTDQTMDPLEEDRWMDWMRMAKVFSRSCRISEAGLSAGVS